MVDKDDIGRIIEQANKLGHKIEVLTNIKSGKEATVYGAMLDNQLVAMKLYKNQEEISFKNTGTYLLGKYYKKLSERRAIAKNNKFAKKLKHKNWVRREFFMLQKLFNSGAIIPKPILQIDDAIFMELLGDINVVAPRLCDIELNSKEAEKAFTLVLKSMEIFWNFGIVHADLSEYNILWWKDKPHIIDFPQSIDRRTHPNPREILERDLVHVVKYFGKYNINYDFNEILNRFKDQ
jgi:RIO kinase 1